ncbi:UvrD-helicase domain-containing protein [Alicyclobacillus vulcanalis]|uniref:DNA helicase-2 / ATP-dependent DNA helicase PcrA n=1 Tax=Alicyclobacillus vulcanalis TaxID=252246 RepID=A0A1N7KK51_9BACL|nr:UvrD-helicase domain-containing protein [Alicyclobacillus vulcanalis]SIS61937.1 DNA helicase-2 / ATP-dependent DNA helicase PcrA [Alicyclobacillus vulcanalis]
MWTEEQWAVIEPKRMSSVVVAAPGSGKTTVMTEHMAQIIAARLIPAQRILAMTFTRQAAEHMRQKLRAHKELRPEDVESCAMGTFHAVFFRALLEADRPVYPVLTQRDQYALMADAVCEVLGERRAVSAYELQSYLTLHSRMVGGQVPDIDAPTRKILQAYALRKRASRRWDHDDILLASLDLFQQPCDPSIRLFQARYILVDEFQDTNLVQWNLLTSLLARNEALGFVVGDDDQSIYGFRGASPEFLQRAVEALPYARQHLLTLNFRSDRSILRHAAQLIHHVKTRVHKPLRGVRDAEGVCQAYEVTDRTEQWVLAHGLLTSAVRRGYSVACLARTRNQLAAAWAALQQLCGTEWRVMANRMEFRTFHDSKGKEWDVVIVLDMAVSHDVNLADADEERRLIYVAMTRARHELHAVVPCTVEGRPRRPHPFLHEAGIPLVKASPRGRRLRFEIG